MDYLFISLEKKNFKCLNQYIASLFILVRSSVSYYIVWKLFVYYKSDFVNGLLGHMFFSKIFSLASHN